VLLTSIFGLFFALSILILFVFLLVIVVAFFIVIFIVSVKTSISIASRVACQVVQRGCRQGTRRAQAGDFQMDIDHSMTRGLRARDRNLRGGSGLRVLFFFLVIVFWKLNDCATVNSDRRTMGGGKAYALLHRHRRRRPSVIVWEEPYCWKLEDCVHEECDPRTIGTE
jgi:hypothetical protein